MSETMTSKEDIEKLEKVIGQLEGLHDEISLLAKKSPNDALNRFKLKLVNKVIEGANVLLAGRFRPFEDFDSFDIDDLPSSSDVAIVLAQYLKQTERFRSVNVGTEGGSWYYKINGAVSDVPSKPPTRVGGDRK